MREQESLEKGRIVLRAEHEENQIVIKVADDGRGIDINKIKEISPKKGIIT
ncbi:hypothetical protein KHA80_23130 [Anaerobacillus sp. HL2]|nr:hypothetical protein KHA80_23130 [Anaerobacillus sp. HL2]